jgi:hypothetical protein
MYKVVSFYTKDTPYEKESRNLADSLNKFDIPYKFYEVESTGDHVKNVHNKPKIILKAMCEHPGKNIVWMDCNAVVLSEPKELELLDRTIDYDFAAVLVWGRPSRNKIVAKNWKVIAGCMFFRNSARMRDICTEWHVNARHLHGMACGMSGQ